jgi:hypothetical protein
MPGRNKCQADDGAYVVPGGVTLHRDPGRARRADAHHVEALRAAAGGLPALVKDIGVHLTSPVRPVRPRSSWHRSTLPPRGRPGDRNRPRDAGGTGEACPHDPLGTSQPQERRRRGLAPVNTASGTRGHGWPRALAASSGPAGPLLRAAGGHPCRTEPQRHPHLQRLQGQASYWPATASGHPRHQLDLPGAAARRRATMPWTPGRQER